MNDPTVKAWYEQQQGPSTSDSEPTVISALHQLLTLPNPGDGNQDGDRITLVITGPCTNIGAFRKLFPDVYENGRLEKCVVMGAAFDIPQWTPYAGE